MALHFFRRRADSNPGRTTSFPGGGDFRQGGSPGGAGGIIRGGDRGPALAAADGPGGQAAGPGGSLRVYRASAGYAARERFHPATHPLLSRRRRAAGNTLNFMAPLITTGGS